MTAYEGRISDWNADVCSSDILALEAAVHGVVLQHVGQVVRFQQVVDGDDLDVAAEILHRRAQHVAPDAAETVDTNLDRHVTLLQGKTGKTRKGKKHAILAVSRPRFHPRRAPSRHENDATPAPRRPFAAAGARRARLGPARPPPDRRAGGSEEHTSELQSLMRISYAVFCLKKKTVKQKPNITSLLHIAYDYIFSYQTIN